MGICKMIKVKVIKGMEMVMIGLQAMLSLHCPLFTWRRPRRPENDRSQFTNHKSITQRKKRIKWKSPKKTQGCFIGAMDGAGSSSALFLKLKRFEMGISGCFWLKYVNF